MRELTVVLPLPRNPERIVTGNRLSSFPLLKERVAGDWSTALVAVRVSREASLSIPLSLCAEEGAEDAWGDGDEAEEEVDMLEGGDGE